VACEKPKRCVTPVTNKAKKIEVIEVKFLVSFAIFESLFGIESLSTFGRQRKFNNFHYGSGGKFNNFHYPAISSILPENN
jgi:hypothetical protein